MEAASIVSRPVIRFSGTKIGSRSSKLQFCDLGTGNYSVSYRARGCSRILSRGFSDSGHLQFYAVAIRCGGKKDEAKEIKPDKKRLKLIKRLSKDLPFFSGAEFDRSLIGDVKGRLISETTEVLLAELKHLTTEQKEQKRKRKEEKALKKGTLIKSGGSESSSSSSSSSSSESSDSDSGEVIDVNRFRSSAAEQSARRGLDREIIKEEAALATSSAPTQEEPRAVLKGADDSILASCGEHRRAGTGGVNGVLVGESGRKIEVCMGGKCRKMGGGALLEEFERRIVLEEDIGSAVVVGCKCMGKCKNGPNVRVLNSSSGIQDMSVDGSLTRTQPGNPICIGVGLDDVDAIVASLPGNIDWNDNRLPAHS